MSVSGVNRPRRGDADGWLTRERVLVFVLAVATAVVFYTCYRLAQPFLPALTWALALAVVAHPLHEWVARRIRSAGVAAGLSVVVVAALIITPTIFVTQRLVGEAVESLEVVRRQAETGEWRARLERHPALATLASWAERQVNVSGEVNSLSDRLVTYLSAYVSNYVWAAVELLVTLFALFYFFRDRRKMLGAVRSLVPLSAGEAEGVFERVAETIHATVYGTLSVALVQGALGGLMFWWLGLPAPFLWGVVMALLSVVPVLGAFLVWVPAAALLLLEGSWGKALILTAWGTIVVGLIDNLLYPVLVGKRLRLHTLPVFIAVIGGLFLFGASGLVLGPVALALAVALIDVWRRRTAGGRAAEAGVDVRG